MNVFNAKNPLDSSSKELANNFMIKQNGSLYGH